MRTFIIAAFTLGAACSNEASQSSDTAEEPTPPPPNAWAVTPQGIGALRAGMTLDEARSALAVTIPEPDSASRECAQVEIASAPGKLFLMVIEGRVVRVDIVDSAIATAEGARVGDSEQRIDSLFSGRVTVQPHKYTDGRYLVVTPSAPADSMFRLLFETDGARVTRYRSGLLPQVAWVEGCA
jgi:hypothetical protein